jgi:CheY-like chemotaxis protein
MKNDKTVLVVEDEQLVRELLVKVLAEHGYQTLEAQDGEEAMKIWNDKKPDLVLLDILLPKMDGFELMKIIRENPNPNFDHASVLVLSNIWQKESIERMKRYNVEDYLVKAYFTVDDVIARIDKIFSK